MNDGENMALRAVQKDRRAIPTRLEAMATSEVDKNNKDKEGKEKIRGASSSLFFPLRWLDSSSYLFSFSLLLLRTYTRADLILKKKKKKRLHY